MKKVMLVFVFAVMMAALVPLAGAKTYASSDQCPSCGSYDVYGWDSGYAKYSSAKHAVSQEYYCNDCSYSWTETIRYENHFWEEEDERSATLSRNGSITYKCWDCGAAKTQSISRPASFELSRTSYIYNGNEKCPTVMVWNAKGNRISSDYYDVYYYDNYSVGKATAVVEFYGKYSGTKKLSYTIRPRGTSIKKFSPLPKGFNVKWKRCGAEADGYQIQYSRKKNFSSGGKRILIKKRKTHTRKIFKLKAGKRYYVRVRTYCKVGNKRYYSAWSKAKSVKTKTTKNNRSYCHNLMTAYAGFFIVEFKIENEYPTYYECKASVYYGNPGNYFLHTPKTTRIRVRKNARVTYNLPENRKKKMSLSYYMKHYGYGSMRIDDWCKHDSKGYIYAFDDSEAG